MTWLVPCALGLSALQLLVLCLWRLSGLHHTATSASGSFLPPKVSSVARSGGLGLWPVSPIVVFVGGNDFPPVVAALTYFCISQWLVGYSCGYKFIENCSYYPPFKKSLAGIRNVDDNKWAWIRVGGNPLRRSFAATLLLINKNKRKERQIDKKKESKERKITKRTNKRQK